MPVSLPLCPDCHGKNVEPQKDEKWFCHDCQKTFDIAVVEQDPEK